MNLKELENRIRLMEKVSDGVLPISALGAAVSLLPFTLAFGAVGLVASTAVGLGGVSIVRYYAKANKGQMMSDLKRYRSNGEISDKKYQELTAILNRLTIDR